MQATHSTFITARKSATGRTTRALISVLFAALVALPLAGSASAPTAGNALALGNSGAPARSQYFSATGKVVQGVFLGTFERFGLARLGYPISEERTENGRTVQYFERVRMEAHPELASRGSEVLMSRLGVDLTGAQFARVTPFKSSPTRLFVPETGHSLAEPFMSFWRGNGAVELFGYPISEPMQQDGLRVQWFERARMEYHPELASRGQAIQLTHLGKLAFQRSPQAAQASQPLAKQEAPVAVAPKLGDMERLLLKAINDQRAAAGLRTVQVDELVTGLTQKRSRDMAERNYFSHTTPEGSKFLDMLTGEGVKYNFAGEILARNNYATPEAGNIAMDSYLKSAPHKAVMLDGRYNYIGVGYAHSPEDGMHYFTVIFVER
jgi:uncharacterized protein YkwD